MNAKRTFRRLAGPLLLGVVLGTLAAVLLGRVLDEAVRERTRVDLAATLELASDRLLTAAYALRDLAFEAGTESAERRKAVRGVVEEAGRLGLLS